MDGQRFDDLTRLLATGTDRRRIVVAAAAVMAGLFTPLRVIRRPVAAAEPTCHGQPYDPSDQCCTPTGVQPQKPIADLDACPERVADPNNVPVSNGCGSGPFGWLVPNTFGRADFKPACDAHDFCYEQCNVPQEVCDQAFLNDLLAACAAAYADDARNLRRCNRRAELYHRVVSRSRRGRIAYEDAQKKGCQCCAPQCTNCGPCDDCVDGVCVSRCDAGCERCEDGQCVSLCDTRSCEVCDGNGGCSPLCDPGLCLVCDGEGNCVTVCTDGQTCVNGTCVDTCDPPCNPGKCEVCQQGKCVSICGTGERCENGTCTGGTCNDGVKNGDETDVDCGGPDCPPCGLGKHCLDEDDCGTVEYQGVTWWLNCVDNTCVMCGEGREPLVCNTVDGWGCFEPGAECCGGSVLSPDTDRVCHHDQICQRRFACGPRCCSDVYREFCCNGECIQAKSNEDFYRKCPDDTCCPEGQWCYGNEQSGYVCCPPNRGCYGFCCSEGEWCRESADGGYECAPPWW